jgi:hypothetical protein
MVVDSFSHGFPPNVHIAVSFGCIVLGTGN